jgi:hypothetical protein
VKLRERGTLGVEDAVAGLNEAEEAEDVEKSGKLDRYPSPRPGSSWIHYRYRDRGPRCQLRSWKKRRESSKDEHSQTTFQNRIAKGVQVETE